VGEITPATIVRMVSDQDSCIELLRQAQDRQHIVHIACQAVAVNTAFSLEVRGAFGVLTELHAEVLRHAIRQGVLTPDELLDYVDNGAALSARLAAQGMSVPVPFETLLDAVVATPHTVSALGVDAPVEVQGPHGRFTLMVCNGYELWRAANFHTQEPETVAWLDDTFGEGDCLYDVGANIGVYTLYALATTRQTQAVCFEPDAVNYYRLSRNVVANSFGRRAFVFPVALSDSMGLATFNSSLFVAGKAENWLSPGTDLLEESSQRAPWQGPPTLRTGCPTFHLDGFLEQAPFLPAPTHLKIDVDSVEVAIVRGAQRTLRRPTLRHLLVELYEREVDEVRRILAATGFHYVRSAKQRNVLPCYEEVLSNHIFTKERSPAS
jgi:FkbM family methyltransferase